MIEGTIIGFLVGSLIGVIVLLVATIQESENMSRWAMCAKLCFVVVLIISAICGMYEKNISTKAYTASFQAAKSTYEEALANENLTGFERVSIIGTAIGLNQELAERQEKIHAWYNFDVVCSNKEALLKLTPIQ